MGRWVAAVTMAGVLTSACTPIVKELRYPGGYPGYLLDQRTFDASRSKSVLLLRSTIILAMASEIGRVTVSGEDADAFAKHLAAASQELNYAAADLYPVSDTQKPCLTNQETDENCSGFYANFEGDIPLIEARIIKVMLAALPVDRARKFLDDAAKGNVLAASWNAVRLLATAVGGVHFAMARYRSGEEIVAQHMAACAAGPNARFSADTMTVAQAPECLGLSADRLFTNPNEAKAGQIANPQLVEKGAFLALMRSVAAACVALPYTGDVAAIDASRTSRMTSCNAIGFKPQARPFHVDPSGQDLSAPAAGTVPELAPPANGSAADPAAGNASG